MVNAWHLVSSSRKFCGCLDLRTGMIFVAIFQMVVSLVTVVSLTTWNTVVLAILCMASGKCLLFGGIRNYPVTCIISLALTVGAVLFYMIASIMSIKVITNMDENNPNFLEVAAKDIACGISMMVLAICNTYFAICIYFYVQERKSPG